MNPEYSSVAIRQLDALEAGADVGLFNAVLDAIQMIFDGSEDVRSLSGAFVTDQGICMKLAVPGYPHWKVFWSTDGPSIEAVLLYP